MLILDGGVGSPEDGVRQAREAGASWTKIGSELGTSGEAARQRYGDKVDV